MYLINYDYYDLHSFITFLRNNPKRFTVYQAAAEQIIEYLDAPLQNGLDFNTVRAILKPYFDTADSSLSWILVNNQYTANIFIIKNEVYYIILSAIFRELIISHNDEQRFCLLCDAVHNIPLILADLKRPKKAVKKMIIDYRNKYNKSFLRLELKQLQ